ncbi:MAG: trehalase family glycosidase [Cyanobacteria bacterium J06598_1]
MAFTSTALEPERIAPERIAPERIAKVRQYIKETWHSLRRGHDSLLAAAEDPKLEHNPGDAWPVYVSCKENLAQIRETLGHKIPEDFQQIALKQLPEEVSDLQGHGLLYLPGDYIVPGGRFNEAYGWDSYFILLGLLEDDKLVLAKSLTEQLLYQVEHYGAVLNANRTYFLSRSQPPLLSRMVLKLYARTQDMGWLQGTLPTLIAYYEYWMLPEHSPTATVLSRFYDYGEGPAPEVAASERDETGRTHFDRIKTFYQQNEIEDYNVSLYYDAEKDELTPLFYRGDRTMRESGFDPTNRFGPFSVDVLHYLPVCLNSLLYQMEKDIAEICQLLGEGASTVRLWRQRAGDRAQAINDYLWDEEHGLYFDYHFPTAQRRHYEFASTFYPLWTGVASAQQAQSVVNNLAKFEAPGGVRTSTVTSGNQWDNPFGWAPLQLIAVEGLRRYGFVEESNRLAQRFVALLIEDFERCGSLVEKYNLDTRSSEVSDGIQYGYSSNEIGFGWTNGVLLSLLDLLDL